MTTKNQKRTISEGYNGGDALDKAAESLIEREVLACQSVLVDACLEASPLREILSIEDAENLHVSVCPDCGEPVREAEESDLDDDDDPTTWDAVCTSCKWQGDHPDQEAQEVLEWWLVSSWLAEKLSERGYVTLSNGQSTWWGRTCSGQSIILDGIMQRIVCETGWSGWPKDKLEPGAE